MEVKDIKCIINTHPHSDHIAGLIGTFDNFKVNNLYYPYDIKMEYYEGFEGAEDITNGHLVNCMNYCYQFYNKVLELANSQETIIH